MSSYLLRSARSCKRLFAGSRLVCRSSGAREFYCSPMLITRMVDGRMLISPNWWDSRRVRSFAFDNALFVSVTLSVSKRRASVNHVRLHPNDEGSMAKQRLNLSFWHVPIHPLDAIIGPCNCSVTN